MKRWLLVLLLLASSVSANSWLDTRSDFYVAARLKFGLTVASSGYLTDSTGHLLYNEAVALIVPMSQARKKVTSINLEFNKYIYPIDTTLSGIISVWIEKNSTIGYIDSIKNLEYLPQAMWNKVSHEQVEGQVVAELKSSSYYDYTDSLIMVFPVPGPQPTTANVLQILGYHRIPDVETTASITAVPEKYRLSVLYHMCWNLAKARNDPRVGEFKEELIFALSRVGLKLDSGGQVVSANQ